MVPAFHHVRCTQSLKPLVSIIIPTHNRETLIVETLTSVFRQAYRPIEIVIVDDGSTDATGQVVAAWSSERRDSELATHYVLQRNQGASAARNRGLAKASGQLVQFLDSDDVLAPGKISSQASVLALRSEADFAYGPVCSLEEPERIIYNQTELSRDRAVLKQVSMPTFHTMGPLCRRQMLDRLGPWDERMRHFEDWEYFSRASVMGFVSAYARDGVSYYRAGPFRPRLSAPSSLGRSGHVEDRFRQLDSMWDNAIPRIRNDEVFRAAIAWEVACVTARAVRAGWSGDDVARYTFARDIAGRSNDAIDWLVSARKVGARRGAAEAVTALRYLSDRGAGLSTRIKRLRSSW